MKILLVGGAGYVGSELALSLIRLNHQVIIYDLKIYKVNFPKNKNLKIIKGDIRNISKLEKILKKKIDVIIHLACISNDPSYELNPRLGKSINYDYFEKLLKVCKKNNIKRFIYASSSSVYGIKKKKDVVETDTTKPLTDYSKYKLKCEKVLFKYNKYFQIVIVRPATVCGFSIRQRLDLSVNILTNFAYFKNKILIFGGNQLRPNIHIKDMIRIYILLLNADKKLVNGQIFNAGESNKSIKNIAKIVKKNFKGKIDLKFKKTNDNRSYHVSSKKIKQRLKFKFKYKITDAVKDLIKAFNKKLLFNTFENPEYHNIKMMKKINLK